MGVCVCECVRVHGHAYTQYHNVCVCVHGCVSVPVILLTGGHFSPFFLSGMSSDISERRQNIQMEIVHFTNAHLYIPYTYYARTCMESGSNLLANLFTPFQRSHM